LVLLLTRVFESQEVLFRVVFTVSIGGNSSICEFATSAIGWTNEKSFEG